MNETDKAVEIIMRLLNARPMHHCSYFYHQKKDHHLYGAPCPAEIRWVKAIDRAQDFVKEYALKRYQEGREK